jgi:hypothetical protein
MKIDSSHRRWMIGCLAMVIPALAYYIPYSHASAGVPSGRSVPGLIFGCVGYGLMLYAALLGMRKKFPTVRVGRASTWMRGHLWLGFLSFPMLLFHSGFAANGPLTGWLMFLLILTITTGLLGAALQHFLPTLMTRLVPLETIYEEIPGIRKRLEAEAEEAVSPLLGEAAFGARFVWGARPSKREYVATIDIEPEAWERFREAFSEVIQPFILDPDGVKNDCAVKEKADALFAGLRVQLPSSAHGILTDLENICEEERQLKHQKRIYKWLHGWLLVHVPLSLALLLLGGIHAAVALWY